MKNSIKTLPCLIAACLVFPALAEVTVNDNLIVTSNLTINGVFSANGLTNNIFSGELTLQTNLAVQGTATFRGQVYIPQLGDLGMGVYTNRP
jgi:hypothetical protein